MPAPTREKIDFTGQTAIVTGAAQGIGRAVADAIAAHGANVAIADLQPDAAETAAAEITDTHGVDTTAIETDVSEYADATRLVDTTIHDLGGLDILVNNAGIGVNKYFTDTTPDEWDHVIGVCQYGTLNCTHAALPHLVDQEHGSIINFASDSYKGNDPHLSVYGAAKAANVSFTQTVAKEVGQHGVRLNCVSPGTTRTPATSDWIDEYEDRILDSYALPRLGKPEDIADAVVFLASDAASWITGQVLSVNGGYIRG